MSDVHALLERYSTLSLKRNELTRWGKKMHLASYGITGARAEEILDALYGKEPEKDDERTVPQRVAQE